MSVNEIFDVVDENDNIIGEADRDSCHSNPKLIHRVVQFTLYDETSHKIFFHKRSLTKKHDPGKICFFGEHVVKGESYEDAIKRGCLEELGFTPSGFKEIAKNTFSYQNQTEIVRFFIVSWHGEQITFDKDEIMDTFWYSPNEVPLHQNEYSEMTQYWIEKIQDIDL